MKNIIIICVTLIPALSLFGLLSHSEPIRMLSLFVIVAGGNFIWLYLFLNNESNIRWVYILIAFWFNYLLFFESNILDWI